MAVAPRYTFPCGLYSIPMILSRQCLLAYQDLHQASEMISCIQSVRQPTGRISQFEHERLHWAVRLICGGEDSVCGAEVLHLTDESCGDSLAPVIGVNVKHTDEGVRKECVLQNDVAHDPAVKNGYPGDAVANPSFPMQIAHLK